MCHYMHVLSSPTEIITGGVEPHQVSPIAALSVLYSIRLARALIMLVREIQTRKQLAPAIDTSMLLQSTSYSGY